MGGLGFYGLQSPRQVVRWVGHQDLLAKVKVLTFHTTLPKQRGEVSTPLRYTGPREERYRQTQRTSKR